MSRNRRAISFALYCLSLPAALEAQESQFVPPNPAITGGSQSTQSKTFQLAVKVRRVVLDVVVTDAKGNPVEGLKQDDFKLTEDGVIQPVHFFDVHNSAAAGESQKALDLHLPRNTFSNLTFAPSDKPVTVLLYDMLDTPQSSLPSAHRALVKFIKDQKSSTKIAIFVLTDRLHLVQGFTDDETRLMQAVNSKKASSKAPPLRAAPFATDADALLLAAEAAEWEYLAIKRSNITVDAFIQIARYVSSLPGRKNLIWMSGSFPPEIFSNGIGNAGSQWQVTVDPRVRAAKKLLDECRVAVYPVDVRGLQTDPRYSAANRYTTALSSSFFGIQQGAEHAAMNVIADSTGGRAFYNTNGLKEAMDAAARQGSEYYTLTYAPSNNKEDGGERNIKVALKDPIYELSYRRMYLADDARHPAPVLPLALDRSMQHGAPNSSQLFFEASVNAVGATMAASTDEVKTIQTLLQENAKGLRTRAANRAGLVQSPWLHLRRRDALKVQHYDIDFAIIGRQLEMPPTESGEFATDLRFGLAAYSEDGDVLNELELSVKNSISAAQYQRIEAEGYHASMLFIVPVEAVSLRMAVRDDIGNRIGTMEIPLPLPTHKGPAADATP